MALPVAKAYSFVSAQSLDEMASVLRAAGPLEWKGGDNDHWGDYYVARLRDNSSRLRIFVDDGRYVVDISRQKSPEIVAFSEVMNLLETAIFPAVAATDVRPHSGW
jgi:hypothetical protein